MADAKLIEQSGTRIFATSGALASNAKIYVYSAGTTTLYSIFTDSGLTVASTNPVQCDSNGLCPYVYVGTASYKVVVQSSGGSTLDTEDSIPGALDTSSLTTTFAKTDSDVSVKSDNYTMLAADLGTVLSVNPSGATKTITLMSAITATNGRGITILYSGTSGQINIATVSSQTITRIGEAPTSMSLYARGQSVTLVSDGANWLVVAETGGGFDAATAMLFMQTAAPTGWVKSATHNDKALRVVSGTASSGGTTAFSTIMAARTIALLNLPDFGVTITDEGHVHAQTIYSSLVASGSGAASASWRNTTTANVASSTTGITAAFGNTARDGAQTTMDFAIQYVDVIVAVKS